VGREERGALGNLGWKGPDFEVKDRAKQAAEKLGVFVSCFSGFVLNGRFSAE
jgi:hypothetical protein